MAQQDENRSIDDALELLKDHGFDGLADSSKLVSFAHLKRLKRQKKQAECSKTDVGNDELQ